MIGFAGRDTELFEDCIGRNQPCSKAGEFVKGLVANVGSESFNRIANQGDAPLALEQAFDGVADTIFRYHSKDDKFRMVSQTLHQIVGMATLKDVERLFLKDDLLIAEKVFRQLRVGIVFQTNEILSQRLGDKLGAWRAFHAVRRKLVEFGVIGRVKAAMGDQKHIAAARRVGELADIGEEHFRSRNVELATGHHKVGLHVHFPEDEVARLHSSSRPVDACNTSGRERAKADALSLPGEASLPATIGRTIELPRKSRCVILLGATRQMTRGELMRFKYVLALLGLCSFMVWAADSIVPLNVKEGLWEVTVTRSMSGMPAAPNLPPDALAKLPPEQRARIEAMMQGSSGTDVRKECITKEKLERHSAFSNDRGDCSRTVVNSSGSKLEMKIHCVEKQATTDGTVVLEAVNSDGVKGTMHSVTNANGHAMQMDLTFSSKYLGPACGEVK